MRLARAMGNAGSEWLVRITAIGVLAWDVCLTGKILFSSLNAHLVTPVDVVGYAFYLPLSLLLVWRGIRGDGSRSSRGLFALLALLIFGALPFGGPWWPPLLGLVAGLGLIFIRPPRSFLLFAACVAAADAQAIGWTALTPGAARLYHDEFATYDTVVVVWTGIALAVLIALARDIARLQVARRQLAARALAVERQRIDDELAQTLGGALEQLIADGAGAARLVREDPEAAGRALRALTALSRTTLADARTVLSSYRTVGLDAELRAVTALLGAAGIRAVVTAPEGPLPRELPGQLRARLRATVAQALADGAAGDYLLVIGSDQAGRLDARLVAEREAIAEGWR